MKKITVGVFGASGRMGQEVVKVIGQNDGAKLGATIDHESGQKLKNVKILPDVFIDFSSPEGMIELAEWCASKKIPLVSGTTGFSQAQEKTMAALAKKIPVFLSPNMGLGVNSLAQALEIFAQNFQEGEVAIVETHHRDKKDKPSGTAKFLAETVKSKLPKKVIVSEPVSLRGGDVFGIHKVYFFGEGEWACFEHQATGRSVFARGALKIALWMASQRPGLFSMKDYFASERET